MRYLMGACICLCSTSRTQRAREREEEKNSIHLQRQHLKTIIYARKHFNIQNERSEAKQQPKNHTRKQGTWKGCVCLSVYGNFFSSWPSIGRYFFFYSYLNDGRWDSVITFCLSAVAAAAAAPKRGENFLQDFCASIFAQCMHIISAPFVRSSLRVCLRVRRNGRANPRIWTIYFRMSFQSFIATYIRLQTTKMIWYIWIGWHLSAETWNSLANDAYARRFDDSFGQIYCLSRIWSNHLADGSRKKKIHDLLFVVFPIQNPLTMHCRWWRDAFSRCKSNTNNF